MRFDFAEEGVRFMLPISMTRGMLTVLAAAVPFAGVAEPGCCCVQPLADSATTEQENTPEMKTGLLRAKHVFPVGEIVVRGEGIGRTRGAGNSAIRMDANQMRSTAGGRRRHAGTTRAMLAVRESRPTSYR